MNEYKIVSGTPKHLTKTVNSLLKDGQWELYGTPYSTVTTSSLEHHQALVRRKDTSVRGWTPPL